MSVNANKENRMAKFDPIVGKYVYLKIQGIEYRVYFEESGKGIPILCQHTAGNRLPGVATPPER